jgi:hypothetical protein
MFFSRISWVYALLSNDYLPEGHWDLPELEQLDTGHQGSLDCGGPCLEIEHLEV